MIRGYVSSDEDDYDDYDFGYSEPLVIEKKSPALPQIQTSAVREKVHSALEESKKIEIFFRAIDRGDLNCVQEAVSNGVSVDCTDSQGWTPLLKACGMADFDLVQFLLEHGADAGKHRELLTPLMTCCTHTYVAEELKLNCVRLLLQHGAPVNAKDKFQTTALMYAAGSGYGDIVAELLAVPGVDINVQDREGWSALFHAVNQNNLDIVEKLLAIGADLSLKDKYGRTVESLALDKNLKKMAAALGYVEEEVVVCKPREQLKDRFLTELPDSNGQGGFPADAQNILNAFNQFNVNSISLPDLLNATEKDLYEVGVKLKPDRHKILSKGIHRFHLHPWKNTSVPQITPGVPLSMEDAIAVTGSLAKHLTIANASLRYLSTRISSRQNKELVDLATEKEMIICLIGAYNSAESLKSLLSKLLKQIEQIKPEIPDDYIYPQKLEKRGKKFVRYFWYIVGATTAGVLIFYKPVHHLRTLVTLLFNQISPLTELYQPEPAYEFFDHGLI